jgi:hypothetical protein
VAESNRTLWVAVAGIAATALVGIAGTTVAWLSARDDRATQRGLARDERAHERALARDERSYEHRVSAYLEAIRIFEGHYLAFFRGQTPGKFHFVLRRAANARAGLTAFGSERAVKAFESVLTDDLDAYTLIDAGEDSDVVAQTLGRFNQHLETFEKIVHDEVG